MRVWQFVAIVSLATASLTGAALAQEGTDDNPGEGRGAAPEACVSEPRGFDGLSTLLALDGEGILPPASTTISPPLGELADAATTAAVTAATQEILSCFNAGDIPRAAGLMTDAGVRRVYWGLGRDAENRALANERLPAPPERRADEFLIRLIAVTDASLLPDGRVAALVVINEPLLPPRGPETLLLVFADQDGRWLLDDLIDFSVAPVTPAAEATPAA